MTEAIILLIILFLLSINIIKYIRTKDSNHIIEGILEIISIIILAIYLLITKEKVATINVIVIITGIIAPIFIKFLTYKKTNIMDIYYSLKLSNNSIKTRNFILNKIEQHPISPVWHKRLAKYYEINKQYEKAEEEYFTVIEQQPNNFEAYCELARILKIQNKREEQVEILENLIKIDPENYKAKMMLGIAYYDNEQYKEALNMYQKMLKVNIGDYDLYYNMAMTYTMLNDFIAAKENYEKAAQINSYEAISKLNIGQINMILRDYEEAKKYFFEQKESEDEKIASYSYYYLAKIAIIEGDIDKAIIYTNTAIEIYPPIKNFIERELRFKIIYGKVQLQNQEKEELITKINQKDEKVVDYLERIYNKVDTLTDNIEHQYKPNEEIEQIYDREK